MLEQELLEKFFCESKSSEHNVHDEETNPWYSFSHRQVISTQVSGVFSDIETVDTSQINMQISLSNMILRDQQHL